jgi:hypothetical protein
VSYEDADQSPVVEREASILGYMLSAGTVIGKHCYGTLHSRKNFHASKNLLVKYGVKSPKYLWAPVTVLCTAVLRPPQLQPSPRIWAHIGTVLGRNWSAEIDDISLQPPARNYLFECLEVFSGGRKSFSFFNK